MALALCYYLCKYNLFVLFLDKDVTRTWQILMNASLKKYLDTVQRISDKKIFFVTGTAKSGTTWLQMLLDHHPEVACKGEGRFDDILWPSLRKTLYEYSTYIAGRNSTTFKEIDPFPVFREEHLGALQAFSTMMLLSEYGDSAHILAIGEKNPAHIYSLGRLKELFPEAKFIFIYRDGRDMTVSGWHHIKRHQKVVDESFPSYVKRVAALWRNDYEQVTAFTALHPDNCALVRYEDLQINPAPELIRLFSFLGLDCSDELAAQCVEACKFDKLSGGRQQGEEDTQSHFRKGVVNDWHTYFDRNTWSIFDAEAGELLEKLGYQREWKDMPQADEKRRAS